MARKKARITNKAKEDGMELAQKLVELRIATRGATMCENMYGKSKNTLSLKTKILFLIRDKSLPPSDIISTLHLAKTNVALIAAEMIKEGLIVKEKSELDKRSVWYAITDKGKEYLDSRLRVIEDMLNERYSKKDYQRALKIMSDAIDILSFI
ncbi:MAG: MarR family transcriptional regulator [Clostridiales bacterium]|nr:MarR family transcriptional regulator [Clostridiales bacterium]